VYSIGDTWYPAGSRAVLFANAENGSQKGKAWEITISGTVPTYSNKGNLSSDPAKTVVAARNDASGKVVAYYASTGGSGRSTMVYPTHSSSNFADFIGISDAAISDTASGSVTIKGGISTNVTGLTANATYYVQADGTLSTTASDVLAGKALSSTSINLDYTT
jgi:hypothetical protein